MAELGLARGSSCSRGSPASSSSSEGRLSWVPPRPASSRASLAKAPHLNLSWLDTLEPESALGLGAAMVAGPAPAVSRSSGLVANILVASWLSSLVTPPWPVSLDSQSEWRKGPEPRPWWCS